MLLDKWVPEMNPQSVTSPFFTSLEFVRLNLESPWFSGARLRAKPEICFYVFSSTVRSLLQVSSNLPPPVRRILLAFAVLLLSQPRDDNLARIVVSVVAVPDHVSQMITGVNSVCAGTTPGGWQLLLIC